MDTRTKVELLAPAGNYQAMIGALNAGADAVYLGGDKFGARAYADNFTEEEICKALRYAHFYGKRIYLTVNTLVKEDEFSQLYDYLAPFYEAGLDGVIIQDLGVWQYIRKNFPGLPLHASTQMTITGTLGATFLKEIGAERIVPARELSLSEIRQIKEQTGLELECFIHGAMCYCYSGQCLFSSILGGRSGNRGRCAQPCRLPYRVLNQDKKSETNEMYPLSLKDMCTIEYIPQLIEAGIDSFKIEGRMKKPEYAAGVTAIYRKYIDAYYEHGTEAYHVTKSDMDRLKNLYIRSEIQTGYYERHNGREMITLHKPSYLGSDEALLQEIATKYLKEKTKLPVTIKGVFKVGEPAMLQIESDGITQITYGEIVQQALGKPLTKESIRKQLSKTGNSNVWVEDADFDMDEAVFMPIGQLNELRRAAVEAFENQRIATWGIFAKRDLRVQAKNVSDRQLNNQTSLQIDLNKSKKEYYDTKLHISVQTLEQLQTACSYEGIDNGIERIYLDSDFYMQDKDRVDAFMEQTPWSTFYLALPYIVREKDKAYLQSIYENLHARIAGFLVRNLESAYFVQNLPDNYDMVTDAGVYRFNAETNAFWNEYCKEGYLPYELNGKETRYLIGQLKTHSCSYDDGEKGKEHDFAVSMVAYGTIPMMITANCLKKTTGSCVHNGKANLMHLQDRYKTTFPVICNCKHCYNIVYNSVPYSLHNHRKELEKLGLTAIRLDFIQESGQMMQKILNYYQGKESTFPLTEYTTGHFKRGVE